MSVADTDLDTWAARHWRLWRLLHPWRSWGPRCGAEPPWRLADAGACVVYRGHSEVSDDGQVWHADGTGYIWSATRWAWRGPMVDLADVLRDHPDRDTWGDQYTALFTEEPMTVYSATRLPTPEPCAHEDERPGWGDGGPTYVCLACGRVRAHSEPRLQTDG